MSTNPGVTTQPSASRVRRASVLSSVPTATIRSPSTATSPSTGSPPEPSTIVPFVMTRSCMVVPPEWSFVRLRGGAELSRSLSESPMGEARSEGGLPTREHGKLVG